MTEPVPEGWRRLQLPGADPGQLAYDAYVRQAGGVSLVSGEPLPGWLDQEPEIQECWRAAAVAIVNYMAVRIAEAKAGSPGPGGHGGRPGMEPIMSDAKVRDDDRGKDEAETVHEPDGTILPEEREVPPEDHGHEQVDDETATVGREPRTGILPARTDDPIANTPGPADEDGDGPASM